MARRHHVLTPVFFHRVFAHPCEGEEELDAEREDGVVVAHVVVRRDHRGVPDACSQ